MFDRSVTGGPLTVEITLINGCPCKGRLIAPQGRSLTEVLNSGSSFIEFEPVGGSAMFVAKASISTVKPLKMVMSARLPQIAEEVSDPYAVLGVTAQATLREVRQAYAALAEVYQPDKSADLPAEIRQYLVTMARRISAAYDALENAFRTTASRSTPIYSHGPEGASHKVGASSSQVVGRLAPLGGCRGDELER